MKPLITLLLLFVPVLAQESNPVLIINAEIYRPSIHAPIYDKPALDLIISNLSNKPIHSLVFEIEFWDSRHDVKADTIKGALGEPNPKYVLLKAGQKKNIRHSLSDYYPPDSWTTDKTKIKITYVKFSDGSMWMPVEK